MRIKLPEKAVAMDTLIDRDVTIDECVTAFKAGFAKALAIDFEPMVLTEAQKNYVKEIEKRKYANDEWNFKKQFSLVIARFFLLSSKQLKLQQLKSKTIYSMFIYDLTQDVVLSSAASYLFI